MNMTPVASSFIVAIGYDPDQAVCAVQFKNGDVKYYSGISLGQYQNFSDAPSLGKAFPTIRDAASSVA
jgi:hypothetical protein